MLMSWAIRGKYVIKYIDRNLCHIIVSDKVRKM